MTTPTKIKYQGQQYVLASALELPRDSIIVGTMMQDDNKVNWVFCPTGIRPMSRGKENNLVFLFNKDNTLVDRDGDQGMDLPTFFKMIDFARIRSQQGKLTPKGEKLKKESHNE